MYVYYETMATLPVPSKINLNIAYQKKRYINIYIQERVSSSVLESPIIEDVRLSQLDVDVMDAQAVDAQVQAVFVLLLALVTVVGLLACVGAQMGLQVGAL